MESQPEVMQMHVNQIDNYKVRTDAAITHGDGTTLVASLLQAGRLQMEQFDSEQNSILRHRLFDEAVRINKQCEASNDEIIGQRRASSKTRRQLRTGHENE